MSIEDFKKGVFLRRKDGTIYFIPDEDLEVCKLPAELQPGGEDGDSIQQAFDRLPPVFDIKNAIHLGRQSVIEAFQPVLEAGPEGTHRPRAVDPDVPGAFRPRVASDNGAFRPRVVAAGLGDLTDKFDSARSYSSYIGQSGSDGLDE